MKTDRIFSCTFAALSILAASILAVGCVAADTSDAGEEWVEEISLGYGEPGCTTVTADATINSSYCSDQSATSADTSYDHGTDCPDQFVTEFTGSVASIEGFGPGWGDAALNSSTCANAKYQITVYAYVSGAWDTTNFQTASYHGDWNGSTCDFVTSGSAPTTIANATKYRLAVKAYSCGTPCWTPVKKKAKDMVLGSPCFGE